MQTPGDPAYTAFFRLEGGLVHTSPAAAAEALRAGWRAGDVVLVKGSRGMRMEEAVLALEDAGRPD